MKKEEIQSIKMQPKNLKKGKDVNIFLILVKKWKAVTQSTLHPKTQIFLLNIEYYYPFYSKNIILLPLLLFTGCLK